MNIKPVIIAGGTGSRLWPISRKNSPKQLSPFLDEETLIQKTYKRLAEIVDPEHIYVSTTPLLEVEIKKQIPVDHSRFIVEPIKKNTSAAIGLSAIRLFKDDPSSIFTNAWADHNIKEVGEYKKLFEVAEEFLTLNPKVGLIAGVKPTYPETGYGYIKMGKAHSKLQDREIFNVELFKEKPDLETAKEYVSKWEYLWNPAYFFFTVEYLLSLYEKYLPEMHAGLMRVYNALGTELESETIKAEFELFEDIAFEYSILEKHPDLFVLPVDLGWADIGHWKSVYDMLADGNKNIVKNARYVEVDSKNNLIFSETDQMISTVGIEDTLVIVSADAILICNKDQAQKVKDLVLKFEGDTLFQSVI